MISVIIPYTKGDEIREKNLKQLLSNIKKQTYKDYELILVEMLFDKPSELNIENCNHICLRYPQNDKFNKSWAINVGVRNSKYNGLFVIDSDIMFGDDYFQKVVDFAKDNPKFFMGYSKIHYETGRDNPEKRVHVQSYLKAAGGVWYADKDFFWSIGGMNETYFGYGAEDNDFWQRANSVLGKVNGLQYEVVHAYHHWHPENSHFPLNKERIEKFNIVMSNLGGAIKKLKEYKLGGDTPQKVF